MEIQGKSYEPEPRFYIMKSRAHVKFMGRVQGVFFRANTLEKARESGLFGWVRNLRDGSVEAVFEGEEESIKNVIEWCGKRQPHARVDDIEVRWGKPTDEFDDFEIRH